ncbi:MAG: phosphate/phosphite/phosphonate ABC transporter substrate-binding protein, partial [Vampirovibrionia bacterium]
MQGIAFSETTTKTINIGIVATNFGLSPSAIMQVCKPFGDYITERLGVETNMKLEPDIDTLVADLNSGKINFGYVINIDYVKLKAKMPDIEPFVKPIKAGNSTFKIIILVRDDSGYNSFSDIKGKSYAYVNSIKSLDSFFPQLKDKYKIQTSLNDYFGVKTEYKKDIDSILAVYYK